MKPRIAYTSVAPEAYQAMRAFSGYTDDCGLERSLLELVRLRVSQINGCAFCVDLHTRESREAGISDERLHGLVVWHEMPYYTDRERAALAWAESVTSVAETRVPDEVFESAKAQFTERELVDLTYAVVAINGWNRLAVSFRRPPSS